MAMTVRLPAVEGQVLVQALRAAAADLDHPHRAGQRRRFRGSAGRARRGASGPGPGGPMAGRSGGGQSAGGEPG